jgi:histidinol-phosphate aminotransferase
MAKKNIYVGRSWPIWPNMARITVGTAEEMQRFRVACEDVLHKPVSASAAPSTSKHTPLSHLG